MKSFVNKSKKFTIKLNHLVPIFLLIIIILIAINPAKYTAASLYGLEVWFKILVPALLPFFILTRLFAKSGLLNDITKLFARPTKLLYACPPISAYIFFMSIITGYPVGAKLVADCHKNGLLTKSESIRTLSFVSNSGPMFILGSVAIGMFANKTLGIIVYASHVIGSLLNGFIYRKYIHKDEKGNSLHNNLIKNSTPSAHNKQKESFSESINSSISSILLIGGVICFTFVIIEMISSSPVFLWIVSMLENIGIPKSISSAFFCGILEITKGALLVSSIPMSFNAAALFCTFIISFGGISTLLQASAFTQNIVPTKIFVAQKITHALCATFVCFIILLII